MKIIVISDTHNTINLAQNAISQNSPDLIIFLGDMQSDCEILKSEFKDIPVLSVAGNSELTYDLQKEIITTIEGKKFFICHGDQYNVKMGMSGITKAASEKQVDICLFGHTHQSLYHIQKSIRFLNPGSCRMSYQAQASYGIIEIINSELRCYIKKVGIN